MKRLTLDQTWEQCLAMWKWISRQCKGESGHWCGKNIDSLKMSWLQKKGISPEEIDHDCFFCEYDERRRSGCANCPGRRIDRDFDCGNDAYVFASKPRLFYAKLKELNKIRLAKK